MINGYYKRQDMSTLVWGAGDPAPVITLEWRFSLLSPPGGRASADDWFLDVRVWTGDLVNVAYFAPLFEAIHHAPMSLESSPEELYALLDRMGYVNDQEHMPL